MRYIRSKAIHRYHLVSFIELGSSANSIAFAMHTLTQAGEPEHRLHLTAFSSIHVHPDSVIYARFNIPHPIQVSESTLQMPSLSRVIASTGQASRQNFSSHCTYLNSVKFTFYSGDILSRALGIRVFLMVLKGTSQHTTPALKTLLGLNFNRFTLIHAPAFWEAQTLFESMQSSYPVTFRYLSCCISSSNPVRFSVSPIYQVTFHTNIIQCRSR